MNRFSPFTRHARWKSQTMMNVWLPTCNFMFKVMSCRLTISSEANSFSGFSSTIQFKRERIAHFYARLLLYSLHVQSGVETVPAFWFQFCLIRLDGMLPSFFIPSDRTLKKNKLSIVPENEIYFLKCTISSFQKRLLEGAVWKQSSHCC